MESAEISSDDEEKKKQVTGTVRGPPRDPPPHQVSFYLTLLSLDVGGEMDHRNKEDPRAPVRDAADPHVFP